MWLGHSRTSDEVLVGTQEGVVRAYSITRRPEADRWDADMVKDMQGTPGRPNPKKPGSIIPVHVQFDAPEEGEVEEPEDKKTDVRRMKMSVAMLRQHGFTEGCEGCKFKKVGLKGGRAHNETC